MGRGRLLRGQKPEEIQSFGQPFVQAPDKLCELNRSAQDPLIR